MSEVADAVVVAETKPTSTAVAKAPPSKTQTVNNTDELALVESAKMLVSSGLAKTGEDLGKIVAKIAFGRGIGLSDVTSVNGLSFSKNGTLVLSAALMLSLIKRSGKYRMKYIERNDQICTIEMWERIDNEWWHLGVPVSFSVDDAKKAKLMDKDTYKQYTRQMLTARCISDVFKVHCADCVNGAAVYTPEEIDGSGYRTDPETLEMVPEVVPKTGSKPKVVQVTPVDDRLGELSELLTKTKSDEKQFLSQLCGVDSAAKLTPDQVSKAISTLKIKAAAMPKGG